MADNNFFTLNDINMPYSMDAEQAVLGCILSYPECLDRVSFLETKHFFIPQHKDIYSAIMTLSSSGTNIDPLVVLDMLVPDTFDKDQGRQYLLNMAQSVPSTANVELYAKIVRENYVIRSLITISSDIIEDAVNKKSTAGELIEKAERELYDISQGRNTNEVSKLNDIITGSVFDTLKKLSGDEKDQYKGYSTGFTKLDNILTGLNKSDLIIVGARPAMGKTSFGLNIARNVSVLSKKKVLFFSLEMTKEQVAMRVLGTEARVSVSKMRNGNITQDDWKKLGSAVGILSSAELYFDDTAMITVQEIKSKARREKAECVIIDYLGLINPGGRFENRVNEVTYITKALKAMAKELNIPVICLAQLNRGTESGKSHRPQLSDLRESGSIEQDADIVMMLYREDYYKNDRNEDKGEDSADGREINTISVIVEKNRHGSTGTVDFAWDGDHTLFIQIDDRHDD